MDHAEDVKKHVKVYVMVFLALGVGTIFTVAASSLEVGVAVGIIIAMIIATIKGSLVAGFFMHLANEKKLVYTVLGITVVLFFAMIFITSSTIGDQVGERIVPEDISLSVH